MNNRFKCETIKLLEENLGESLQALGHGGQFLDMTPKTTSIKEKKKQIELHKTQKNEKTYYKLGENISKPFI